MSACVTVCDAVQVIDAPGATDDPFAGVQLRLLTFGSETVRFWGTLPVFVATIV